MKSKVFESTKGQTFSGFKTICETHRQIYDLCVLHLSESDPDFLCEIIPHLEEAFLLGIKIVNKLIEHKINELQLYEKTSNDEEVRARRARRIELMKTLKENEEILNG